jgi:hypothetical protein
MVRVMKGSGGTTLRCWMGARPAAARCGRSRGGRPVGGAGRTTSSLAWARATTARATAGLAARDLASWAEPAWALEDRARAIAAARVRVMGRGAVDGQIGVAAGYCIARWIWFREQPGTGEDGHRPLRHLGTSRHPRANSHPRYN